MPMKCQRCPKAMAYSITDIQDAGRIEEMHFCPDCAKKFLQTTPLPGMPKPVKVETSKTPDHFSLGEKQCPDCGIKFVEFRNGGRFGCPNDYETFSEDLIPLLEGVHGTVKHAGKTPKNRPKAKASHNELTSLRKKLQSAIDNERYEEAAQLRDRIKQLETY